MGAGGEEENEQQFTLYEKKSWGIRIRKIKMRKRRKRGTRQRKRKKSVSCRKDG